MSSMSSLDIFSVVVLLDPNIFVCFSVSSADAAAVNPNEIKTFLAYG